ncbi:MAG: hypothetical protein HOH66_10160 [Rhodospirillaceae bacterium]|jgi:hypothetical protein|nr:hypothetical protein [Rhodospirillaceae bacterium]MBT6118218.1 hypothetical protein [Rhodospirillaceae bacterium]
MAGDTATDRDRESLTAWLEGFSKEIQTLDYTSARARFVQDVTTFSTHKDIVSNLDEFEHDQWRHVWHTSTGFHWDTAKMRFGTSADRLMAWVAVPCASTGYHEDGTEFDRPGRGSLVLTRKSVDAPWQGVHVHVSLRHGVPAKSHGKPK